MSISILLMVNVLKPVQKTADTSKPVSGLYLYIFFGLGFLSGFLGMLVGVTGPFISPFFLQTSLDKEQNVATKAACQLAAHLIKIPAFIWVVHFDFFEYSSLLAALCAVTVLGALLGNSLLKKMESAAYHHWERVVLSVLAVFMLVKSLL